MLILTLPQDGKPSGRCKINGERCQYRIVGFGGKSPQLWFRPATGRKEWDKRLIISMVPCGMGPVDGLPGQHPLMNIFAVKVDGAVEANDEDAIND